MGGVNKEIDKMIRKHMKDSRKHRQRILKQRQADERLRLKLLKSRRERVEKNVNRVLTVSCLAVCLAAAIVEAKRAEKQTEAKGKRITGSKRETGK